MIIDFRINFQIFRIIFQTVVKYYPIELIVILDMITDTEMKDLILKFAMGWGDVLLHKADIIVMLHCDKTERYKRLKKRETEQA